MNTGQQSSFEDTATPYREELLGYALRLSRNEPDAEDLVQEAFTNAYASFHRFQRGTNFRAWIYRILYNHFVNTLRRWKTEYSIVNADDTSHIRRHFLGTTCVADHTLEEQLFNGQLDKAITDALEELPKVFRQVVVLSDIQGFEYKDIAHILDCPQGTVMSRLHRGRRLLRTQLADYAAAEGITRTPRDDDGRE